MLQLTDILAGSLALKGIPVQLTPGALMLHQEFANICALPSSAQASHTSPGTHPACVYLRSPSHDCKHYKLQKHLYTISLSTNPDSHQVW